MKVALLLSAQKLAFNFKVKDMCIVWYIRLPLDGDASLTKKPLEKSAESLDFLFSDRRGGILALNETFPPLTPDVLLPIN